MISRINSQDLAGRSFGKWLVLRRAQNDEHHRIKWLCRCTGCQAESEVRAHNLLTGRSNSCRKCIRAASTFCTIHSMEKIKCGAELRCPTCRREYLDRTRGRNTRKKKEHRLRSGYGVNVAHVWVMYAAQEGRCATCGTDKPGGRWKTLHIDHDHTTGEMRGLLCNDCNMAIGMAKDSPERLEAMAAYLRERGGRK